MDTELKKGTAKYRLLFFQPNPEDGERVCVGVLLEEEYGRSYSVLYDEKFPKVHCIAPHAEPELIKFYLDDLHDALRSRTGDDPILTLRRYGPQLIASDERLVSLPITETIKLRLLERFVGPCGMSKVALNYVEAQTSPTNKFAEHIGRFVGDTFRRPKKFGTRARRRCLATRGPTLERSPSLSKGPAGRS